MQDFWHEEYNLGLWLLAIDLSVIDLTQTNQRPLHYSVGESGKECIYHDLLLNKQYTISTN